MASDDRPVPTDLLDGTRSDIVKRIPQAETLRRGKNVPSQMQTYLDGYIDAHYQIKGDLASLDSMLKEFDRELRTLRVPTCNECNAVLGDEWSEANEQAKGAGEHPAECPECGENPLPPVGGGGDA